MNDYLAEYLINKESFIKAESSLTEILINPNTNSPWKVKFLAGQVYFDRNEINTFVVRSGILELDLLATVRQYSVFHLYHIFKRYVVC